MLLDRLTDASERIWYIRQVVEQGWSRNILSLQIDARAHARAGASTGASAYVKTPPTAVFASYLVRLKARAGFDPRFLA